MGMQGEVHASPPGTGCPCAAGPGSRAPCTRAAAGVGGVASNDRFHGQAMTDSTASRKWKFIFWFLADGY